MQLIDVEGVREAWVLHRGALGDSVLTWPLLRHLVKSGVGTAFVADLAKAELASVCVGVRAVDAESQAMLALCGRAGRWKGSRMRGWCWTMSTARARRGTRR